MGIRLDKLRRLLDRGDTPGPAGVNNHTELRPGKAKLSASERVTTLLDEGSFEEMFALGKDGRNDDGVICGKGLVDGRDVYVFAQNAKVCAGSLSRTMADKICALQDAALQHGAPIVGLNESGGARIQEGIDALAGYGDIFERNIMSSGVIPQISAIMGPCAGGAVYSPALTDFTVMVENAGYMFLTGPSVVKSVSGEDVDMESLGGTQVHTGKSGAAHFAASDEIDALQTIRTLLSFLPQNCHTPAPVKDTADPSDRYSPRLNKVIPHSPSIPYDMLTVIREIADDGHMLEVQKDWAGNILTGFAHIGGRSVGIVANQPMVRSGMLDIGASRKAARFVRFCDAFGLPIITLVDVPGFLPGSRQEHAGIISHGAKLLYAYGEASVPKVTITLRKSYGGAHIAMGSKQLHGGLCLAWPTANIAVMGSGSCTGLLHGRELAAESDTARRTALYERLQSKYDALAGDHSTALGRGYIDEIIEPATTRSHIIRALSDKPRNSPGASSPSRKHGNIPL